MSDEDDPFDHETNARPKHGRPNPAKRANARRLLRGLQWVELPLFFWAGSFPLGTTPEHLRYKPLLQELALQLGQKPAGLYTFELTYIEKDRHGVFDTDTSTAPRLTDLCPINEDRVLEANQSLVAARRFPFALPPLLPCPFQEWEAGLERRLRLLGTLVRAGQCLAASPPGSPTTPVADPCRALIIEEECLWVGPDSLRPSQTTPTIALRPWLASAKDRSHADPLPGARVAAIVLGRRHVGAPLPGDLGAWSACGARFPSWPADLIVRLARVMGGPRGVLRLAGDLDKGAEAHAPAFLDELLLADPAADVPSLLSGLPLLLESVGSARREIQRRRDLLIGSVQQAFRHALEGIPEGVDVHLSRQEVARHFHRDLARTITGVVAKGIEVYRGFCDSPSASIVCAGRWSLGVDLELSTAAVSPGSTGRAWVRFASDSLESLASESRRLVSEPPIDQWKSTVAGLAGRICAITHDPETLLHLGEFLESAQATLPPGPDGAEALTTAARIVEYGLWASERQPKHLRCFLDLLASADNGTLWHIYLGSPLSYRNPRRPPEPSWPPGREGPSFASEPLQSADFLCLIEGEADSLRAHLGGNRTLARHGEIALADLVCVWPLARLGDLDREQARRSLRLGWVAAVAPLMLVCPEHVPLYADWLEGSGPDGWTPGLSRQHRHLLFVNPQTAFVRSLAKLVQDLQSTHGISWWDLAYFFIDDMSGWYANSSTQAETTFLHQRLWILKAIVEAAVRVESRTSEERPPRGFSTVLRDLGTVLHLLFRWHQNGFTRENYAARLLLQAGERDLVAFGEKGVLAWLRRGPQAGDRLVDASAGDPDQLVALLQHPLVRQHGWELLDALGGLLRRSSEVRRLFLSASGHETLTTEIRRLASTGPVERILAGGEIDSILMSWRDAAGLDITSGTGRDPLEILRRCGLLTAEASSLPRALRPLPDPCIAWRRELEVLESMEGDKHLPASTPSRSTSACSSSRTPRDASSAANLSS